jgi:hypothetical protein
MDLAIPVHKDATAVSPAEKNQHNASKQSARPLPVLRFTSKILPRRATHSMCNVRARLTVTLFRWRRKLLAM